MKKTGFGEESIASIGTALSVNLKANSAFGRVGEGKDDSRCNLFTEEEEEASPKEASASLLDRSLPDQHRGRGSSTSAYERSVQEAMTGARLPSSEANAEEPLLPHSRSSTEGLAQGRQQGGGGTRSPASRNSFSTMPASRQQQPMPNGMAQQEGADGPGRRPLKFTDVGPKQRNPLKNTIFRLT
jgi:hypothetical protein